MNKCPRCENENLKEDYNYCPICGVDLEKVKLNKIRSIQLLRDIKDSFENYKCSTSDQENRAINYSRALEYAINKLELTAQEVPVQEQLVKNIVRKELFEIEKKRYKELKLFYFINMIMLICLVINSIGILLQK